MKQATPAWKREVLTWPNAVTSVRFLCSLVLFAWPYLLPGNRIGLFWIVLIGALSDILDGILAKQFGMGTQFGKRFDQYTDWLFGIATMYTIYWIEGVSIWDWPYNGELLLLISGYLLWRLKYPKVETSWIAKIKTGMQFAGGVMIIAGGVHVTEYLFATDTYDLEIWKYGYQLVWASVGLMLVTGVDYRKTTHAARPD